MPFQALRRRQADASIDHTELERAAGLLRDAKRVLVITGAGMSADSGLPTYRGIGGLYDTDRTEDGVAIEDALSGAMFERDPALTWKYIAQIEAACRGAAPNRGHAVLAEWTSRFERLCVLTQNVDGFHRIAGSDDVIEMHGNIHGLSCVACRHRTRVDDYAGLGALPPRCEICGGVLRPDVVLFGEMLPARAVTRYERALSDGFDVVMSIGTTAVFPYIAAPVREAWQSGHGTIEINPQPTDISRFCHAIMRAPAARVLERLSERIG